MKKLFSSFVYTVIALHISSCTITTRNLTSIADYEILRSQSSVSNELLPKIEELSSANTFEFNYSEYMELVFSTKTITLIVDYSADMYEQMKQKYSENFNFLANKPINLFGKISIEEIEFDYNSFHFKIIESKQSIYPKDFCLYAYSDINKKIAFLYFKGEDLDIVKNPSKELIEKYFRIN